MATDLSVDVTTEQQWCIDLRGILNANRKIAIGKNSSSAKELTKADDSTRKTLGKLSQLDPALAKKYEAKYLSLAENAKSLNVSTDPNLDAIKLVSVELKFLEAQISKEIAQKDFDNAPTTRNKSEKKALGNAESNLKNFTEKMEGAYQKAMLAADNFLFALTAQAYCENSESYVKLKGLRDDWKLKKSTVEKSPETSFFDYALALTELATCVDLNDEAEKEIKADQETEARRKEHEPKYKSKVERLEIVQSNLNDRLGLDEEVKQIVDICSEAKTKLEPETTDPVTFKCYDTAFKHIKEAYSGRFNKTSTFESNALKKEAKFRKDLLKDGEISPLYTEATQLLEALMKSGEELILSSEYDTHSKAISGALNDCTKEQIDTEKGKDVGKKKLIDLIAKFKEIALEKGRARTECNRLLEIVEPLLKDLAYAPQDEDFINVKIWLSDMNDVRTDMGLRDFESGLATLQSLEDLVGKAHAKSTTKPSDLLDKWENGEYKPKREFLEGVTDENSFEFKHFSRAKGFAKAGDFVKAFELTDVAYEHAQKSKKQLEFQKTEPYKQIVQKVEPIKSRCDQQIIGLPAKLNPKNDESIVKTITALVAKKKTILDSKTVSWEKSKQIAISVDELNPFEAVFQNFEQSIIDLLADPKAMRGEIYRTNYELELVAFNQELSLVDKQFEQLASQRGGDVYKDLLDERNGIEDSAPAKNGGFAESIRQLEALKTKISEAIRTAGTERGNLLTSFNQKHGLLVKSIANLNDSIKGESNWSQRKFFKPLFDDLEIEAEAIKKISDSTSISALEQGLLEIEKMEKVVAKWAIEVGKPVSDLGQLVADALGKNDPIEDPGMSDLELLFTDGGLESTLRPDVTPSFSLVLAGLDSIEKELDNKDLKEIKPTLNHLLNQDFEKLKSDVRGLEPGESLSQMRKFQSELSTALDETEVAKAKRTKLQGTLLPFAKELYVKIVGVKPGKKIKFLNKIDKAYFVELETDYLAIKGIADSENKEDDATEKVGKLIKDLQDVADDPSLLQERETEAQNKLRTHEDDEKRFKTAVSEYRNKSPLPQVKEALKIDGADQTLLTDCENLVKKAEGIFNDTGNYESAVTILELAKDRASYAIANPLGTAATARGELKKVAVRWKKSIKAFSDSVTSVKESISNALKEEENSKGSAPPPVTSEKDQGESDVEKSEETIQQIKDAGAKTIEGLEKLRRAFNPDQFDASIETITTKKIPPRDARAARESALKDVRRYMSMVMKDPLMIKVMKTPRPFGVVELSIVYNAIRDLDLNLQRAVQ